MENLKNLFLLDEEVIFLNHGSFGACPRPVFEKYQAWQRALERQPVEFLGRRANQLLARVRSHLAQFVGCLPDEVVYFPNPTTAINMVARNLSLQPGDEILTTDHEYGAMDRTWRSICRKVGAVYRQQPIPLPLNSREEFLATLRAGLTERTRLIFLSHITSPTALIFPVDEVCRMAREAGVLCIVDGAHAPGQIDLNLAELDVDLYAGACHKWLMAPKGAAFLYARPQVQPWLDPLVVSWGYESEYPSNSQYIDYHEWQGTRDISPFLTVPAAIAFQKDHRWADVRQRCHKLAAETRERINAITGLPSICPSSPEWFAQMCSIRLPKQTDLERLKTSLYDDYRIEVPTILWNGQKFLRVSFQGYNDQEDADRLISALERLI